jgi:hypothetical protein
MSDSKRQARVYFHTIVIPTSYQLTPALIPANADPTGRAQRSSGALARQRWSSHAPTGRRRKRIMEQDEILSNFFHHFEKNNEFYFFIHSV